MSAHVNEFSANHRLAVNGVQTDARKLKFNNIQSCIACVLCVYNGASKASGIKHLMGVHLNTGNFTNNGLEVNIAMAMLKQPKGTVLDVYLVGPYELRYAATGLLSKLGYLKPQQIKLGNFTPAEGKDTANKDVKFEVMGNDVAVYQRDCVKIDHTQTKPKYDVAKGGTKFTMQDAQAGRQSKPNDKADKPWVRINNFQMLQVPAYVER